MKQTVENYVSFTGKVEFNLGILYCLILATTKLLAACFRIQMTWSHFPR